MNSLGQKQSYSILFIEDEDAIRKNYVLYLKYNFVNVYEAKDAESGYEIYKDKKPDILIVDIDLPKMSGLDLLTIIRKKDHTTKALILTAYTTKEFLLKASELKLTKYLLKPITRDELSDALALAIDEINSFNITSKDILFLKDNYTWNYLEKKLFKYNEMVSLTIQEIKILDLFFNNLSKDLSYEDIIIYVWDDFENDKENSV